VAGLNTGAAGFSATGFAAGFAAAFSALERAWLRSLGRRGGLGSGFWGSRGFRLGHGLWSSLSSARSWSWPSRQASWRPLWFFDFVVMFVLRLSQCQEHTSRMRQNSSPRGPVATRTFPICRAVPPRSAVSPGGRPQTPSRLVNRKTFRRKKSELCGPGMTSNSISYMTTYGDNISQV
jgi:hypothetical protein